MRSQVLRTILAFGLLTLVGLGIATLAFGADLAPSGITSLESTSVYKCFLAKPGVPARCERIAGEPVSPYLPLATATGLGGTVTENTTRGASANCRVIGTGPGYAIVACGSAPAPDLPLQQSLD